MAQLIKGVVDTQKNSYRSIGQVNAADDLELELEVKMNGQPIEFINPQAELLIKKSDNNRIRQTKDILYQDGKFKIKVDEQGVTYPGIVTCQLLTREDGRVSTCLFYFMVGTSLDREVLQSISKVEVLEELDEYVATAFANLDEYEKRIISADETIRKLNDDMNEAEKIRGASELERQETFKDLKENMNATISNLESSINLSNMNEKERSEVFNSLKSNLESIKQDLINLNASVESEEEKRVQAEINRVNKALEIIEKLESTNNSVATAEAERVSEFNKIKTENNTLKEALTTINNTANSNEEVRKENETSRVEAEKARVNEFNTMKLENETFKQEINEQYDNIASEFDKAVANVTNGNENVTNSEIVQARGKEVNLNARLTKFDSQLDNKANKDLVANALINKRDLATKIELEDLSSTVIGAIKGETNVNLLSIPQDDSTSYNKLSPLIKSSIDDIISGELLIKSSDGERTKSTYAGVYGYANTLIYKGEKITSSKIYVRMATYTGAVISTIRKASDMSIIATSQDVKVPYEGEYLFIYDKEINYLLYTEENLIITLESKDRTDKIYQPSDTNDKISDRILISNTKQINANGDWVSSSSSYKYILEFELYGLLNLNKVLKNKVDYDYNYNKIKESNVYLQASNVLFKTQENKPYPTTTVSGKGWGNKIKYNNEIIHATKIYVAKDNYTGYIKSTIRNEEFEIIASSDNIKPSCQGEYIFVYDKEINSELINGSYFYITLECVDNIDNMCVPSIYNKVVVTNKVDLTTGSKQLSSSGKWVDINSSLGFVLHVYFCNNNISEAMSNKKDNVFTEDGIEVKLPNYFYTVCNDCSKGDDLIKERHISLPIYVDYLFDHRTNILFNNNVDKFNLFSTFDGDEPVFNNNNDVYKKEISIDFNSDLDTVKTVQISTKASIPNKKSFILTIGDSLTFGYQAQGKSYWKQAAELFEKESIDFERDNNITFIGVEENREPININYKGVNKTIYASAEGHSGWSGLSYLRYSVVRSLNQDTWDILGLGDGSKTDYVDSEEQRDLIRNTCEVNTTLKPTNPFFDNDKTGTNRFSIKKMIERYRTLDDEGNRLTLGEGTGTLITEENINTIDVCTPTHIVISLGHNDFARHSVELFKSYLVEMINSIREELPNVYIIITLSPPIIGAWNPELYPSYENIPTPLHIERYYENANYWIEYFRDYDEIGNKTFLLPNYYVTPTAEGFKNIEYIDGAGNKKYIPYGDGISIHPNYKAHANWGYQLYSLLKYINTLN